MNRLQLALRLGIGLSVLTLLSVAFYFGSDIAHAVPAYYFQAHFWTALAAEVAGTIWFYIQEPGTWVFLLLVLMPAVIGHEFGHFMPARFFGLTMKVFSIGFFRWPRIVWKMFGTEFQATPWLLGGYVSLDPASDEFQQLAAWKRSIILLGGVTMNLLMTLVVVTSFYIIKGEPVLGDPRIVDVTTRAAQAGIQPGDIVTMINGDRIVGGNLHDAIINHCQSGTPLQWTIKRDGETLTRALVPDAKCTTGTAYVADSASYKPVGPVAAVYKAGALVWRFTAGTFSVLASAVQSAFIHASGGQPADGQVAIHGLLAAIQIAVLSFHAGLFPMIQVFCMINVSLFVLNLLPIPVLDGGYILFILIEKVRGKPLSKETQLNLSLYVGLIVIAAILATGFYNDLFHPVYSR
jgi:regulator of sigma E protease